jgi:hypothetical protein
MRASERARWRANERLKSEEAAEKGGAGRAGAPGARGGEGAAADRPAPTAAAAPGELRAQPASLRCKCGPSARRFRRPFKDRAPGRPPPTPHLHLRKAGTLAAPHHLSTPAAPSAPPPTTLNCNPLPRLPLPHSLCAGHLAHPKDTTKTPLCPTDRRSVDLAFQVHTLESAAEHKDAKGRAVPTQCSTRTPSRRAASHIAHTWRMPPCGVFICTPHRSLVKHVRGETEA